MTGRVLIVDDQEPVRKAIRSLFTRSPDWSVCGEAADGLEAVEEARRLRPDVVLMDTAMPRMDGLQATRGIRQEVPEAEVVLISQNDSSVVRRQATEIGALYFVAKCDLARDLLSAIDKPSTIENRK
jgi:DNA-binding NarL/FixJ family response regulator